LLEVRVLITKSDGKLPDTAKQVAPINNIGHSMWEAVRLIINDKEITKAPGLYPFKAYISNVLTYDTWVKAEQLSVQGYYTDTAGRMLVTGNTGFAQRNALFRDNYDKSKSYRADGACFITRLHHDLISATTGLPPGTKVSIELDRASDEFVLLKEETDTEKYKLKLLSVLLFVPIAQLSQDVFLEIDSILTKKKPVGIQYRSLEVRALTIPKNSQNFHSELLFTEEVPARLVVVFLESSSKSGSYTKNPFNFQRKWTVPKSVEDFQAERLTKDHQSDLGERLRQLEEINKQLLESVKNLQSSISSSSKGKGKKSAAPTPSSSCASVTNNLQNVTLNDLQSTSADQMSTTSEELRNLRSVSSRSISTNPNPEDFESSNLEADETKDVFIRRIQLLINGSNIDQGRCYKTFYSSSSFN